MANRDFMSGRRGPYAPKSLPPSIRPTPPSSLASRAAAGPYSLASASKQTKSSKSKGQARTKR